MNEELRLLFDQMQQNGMVPQGRSFEDFSSALSVPDKQAELYGFLRENGLESRTQRDFLNTYFAVKKKDGGESLPMPSLPSNAPAPIAASASEPNLGDLIQDTPAETTGQTIPAQVPPVTIDLNITGDEDPVESGEEIRKQRDKAYDYRKKYDDASQYRQEKRQAENAVLFGERARMQAGIANDQLKMKFGENWLDRLNELDESLKTTAKDDPAYRTNVEAYNQIVGDEFFQKWQAGQKAGQKALEEYKTRRKSGELGRIEQGRAAMQRIREQYDSVPLRTMDGAVRTGADIMGALISLPRTIGRSTGLIDKNDFTAVDAAGSFADEITQFTNNVFPKASKFEQRLFEKRVQYDGKTVVVDDKGKVQTVRNQEGNVVPVTQQFVDDFEASGEAAKAKSEFTGAGNLLDKVAGVTTDLMVMRVLGQGTKVGTALASFANTHQGAYQEAVSDLAMSPNDAAQYSMMTSAIQGAIEAYVGNIESMVGKAVKIPSALSTAQMKTLVQGGKMTGTELAIARMMPVIKSVAGENAEEILQTVTDNKLKGEFNAATGAKLDNQFDANDLKEIVLLTTLATAPMGGIQSLRAVDDMKRRAALSLVESPEKFEYALKQLESEGSVTPEQGEVLRQRAATLVTYEKNLPANLSDDQKSAVLAKEWNRMEFEQRATQPNTLPAQQEEAKAAATALKNEMKTDLSATPEVEPPTEEDSPTSGKVGGLQIAVEDSPVSDNPPIQVDRLLPDAFRQAPEDAPPSTEIATMFANSKPAKEVEAVLASSPEAAGDEIGDMAIQTLRDKGYEATEAEVGQIRRFFVDSLQGQDGTVEEAFNTLADEYIETNTAAKPLRQQIKIETIEDKAADFFSGGGKINPQSFDRNADKNLRDDKSVSGLYFKRDGANIDQLAQSWADEFGISEPEAVRRITDFIITHGKKNVGEYQQRRINEQNAAAEQRQEDEIIGQAVEEVEGLDEEEARAFLGDVRQEVESATQNISPEVEAAAEAWLSEHLDEKGRISPTKVRQAIAQTDLTPLDEGFDPAADEKWSALPPEAQNLIKSIGAGKPVETQTSAPVVEEQEVEEDGIGIGIDEFMADYQTGDQIDIERLKNDWNTGGEFRWAASLSDAAYNEVEKIVNNEQTKRVPDTSTPAQQGDINPQTSQTPGENQGIQPSTASESPNESVRPVKNDTAGAIQVETEAWLGDDESLPEQIAAVDAELQTIELPTKLSPAIVAELADQGLVSLNEANQVITALNMGEELPEETTLRLESLIPQLREVPEWLSVFNDAVLTRAKNVLAGTEAPGQPIIAEHAGEVMIGNVSPAQAAVLKRNGATLRGRAWVFSAEDKDRFFASVFATKPEPTKVQKAGISRIGSFGGMVNRFFGDPAGNAGLQQMEEAISEAGSVDEKIEAAANRLPDMASKAVQVGQALSERFGIEVVTDPEQIKQALIDMGRPELVGDTNVRGFKWNGKTYMNLDGADAEVPIHEFGHFWEESIRGTQLHQQGVEAIKGSKYEQAVRNNPNYAGLTEEEIMAEALAHAIGQRGAMIVEDRAWKRFQNWMGNMWAYTKSKIGIDAQDMKAQEFADYAANILLNEETPSPLQGNTKAQFLFVGEQASRLKEEVRNNLDVARDMETNGIDADEIWNATGWFRGVDSQWRYMIGDNQARIRASASILTRQRDAGDTKMTLGDVLHHPALFDEMPELQTVPVILTDNQNLGVVQDSRIEIDPQYVATNYPDPDSALTGILLHETQHIIQHQMGFSYGGSVDSMDRAITMAIMRSSGIDEYANATQYTPYQLYERLAGEVEARIVQDFRGYSPEEIDRSPVNLGDVAIESQIVLHENTINEVSRKLIAGIPPKAAFLFGRKQVANAAAMQAGQKILDDEITAGNDPAANGTLDKLSKLGINRATAERMYADAQKRAKGARIVSFMGKKAFSEQTWEVIKNKFFEYFRVRGLMPRSLFDLNKTSEAKINAHVYGMQQAINRLGKAIDKTLKTKSDQNRQLIWQQVQNVLEGTQPVDTMDQSLRQDIINIRRRMDGITHELVMSGAVGPSMAMTMLGNAGVDISAADPDAIKAVKTALSKYPSERTPVDNQVIEDFLQTYGGALGNYLYRSYQANDDKNWKYQVTEETVNRAKARLEAMIRQEMAEAIQAMQDKNADLDKGIQVLQDEIKDKLDVAKLAADDVRNKINDLAAKQQAYMQSKGKPNKSLQRQELAASRRLRAMQQMIRQEEAVANLSPADFALMINAPGFDPLALNTIMKAIYSRRKAIMELEARKLRAQTASFARLQYLDAKLQNLDHEIARILERDDNGGSLMSAGKLGSVSAQVTQGKRQDIPEELRDLLGEYRDPRVNMMRSIMRVATALEHQKFLLAAKDAGIRDGWLATDETRTGNLTVQIAPPGSDTMDPLNGLWTTPEIANIFNTANNRQQLGWMARIYYATVGAVKVGKTVLSTGAQGVNLLSNMFQAIYNGWIGFPMGGQKFEAFLGSMKAFKGTQSEKDAIEFERMVAAGVLGNSTTAGEIRSAAINMMAGVRGEPTPGIIPKGPAKVYEFLAKTYQATDEMLRIWGFRVERERYARALYGQPYDTLTPQQQQQLFDRAASVIRRITPDYGMIPKIGELLRQNPATGTFVSWQMEVFRNYFNRFALAHEEYRDPKLRHIGISRLAYLAAGHGAWAGLSAGAAALAGIGDEEETAVEPWMKPWQQGMTKVWTSKNEENGEWTFFNLGHVDPYSFWQRPYSTMTDPGMDGMMDRSLEAATQLMGPIIQPDLVAATLTQVMSNTNLQTGEKIMLPEYGADTENAMRLYTFIRKRLQPGILKTATDLIDAGSIGIIDEYGNVQTPLTIGANAIGLKFETLQPKIAFDKYILSQRLRKEAILKSFDRVRYGEIRNLDRAIKGGQLTDSQIESRKQRAKERIEEMYSLTDETYNRHLLEMQMQIRNAYTHLGIPIAKILDELKSQRYNSDEISVIMGAKPSIKPRLKKVKL